MTTMTMTNAQTIAWAKFQAFRAHPPSSSDESDVARFHAIVAELEETFYLDLTPFHVPLAEMKPRVVSSRRASYSGRSPGRVRLSEKLYCDPHLALRQIDGIVLYFDGLQPLQGTPRIGF
jgi:hypothetical protein